MSTIRPFTIALAFPFPSSQKVQGFSNTSQTLASLSFRGSLSVRLAVRLAVRFAVSVGCAVAVPRVEHSQGKKTLNMRSPD